jgi:glycosyltransferase involved in cell wall biosynthesis
VEGSGIQEYLPPENGCLAGGSDVQSLKNVILKAQSVKTAARFSNTTPTGCAPNYNELHNAIDPRTTFQDAGAISAVITCYNMGEFIEETVFSLWAGLDRDRDEVIVVDDGSTDDLTVQVLDYLEKTAECQIVRTRNYGVSAARNFGISKSSHDIVIVWDGDDLMQPDFVERGRKALINNPRVGALYPWLKREPSIDGHIRYNWDFAFPWGLCSNTGVSLIMLRKEAFLSTAGYNQEMKYNYADWDFLISLKEKGWECRALPLPLGIYKIRQNSMLRSITPHRRSFVLQQISRLHSQTFDRYAFEIVQLAQANSDYFLAESNPASSYDRLGKITPEREASRCMMNTLKRANKEGKRTAVIYGAGAHTIKVLSALASSPIKIIAIVDDNQEKHGRHFLGWPIVSLEDVRKLSAEALIISSDTIEPVLHNKASSVLAATNVKVYSVYA